MLLRTPKVPEIYVEQCTPNHACFDVVNMRALVLYLQAVKRYHEHINAVCPERK